jgi:hypothetical protein
MDAVSPPSDHIPPPYCCHLLSLLCHQPGVVALQLSCPKYCLAPTGFLWLNLPSVSTHQWHPFEYIAVQQQAAAVQPSPDTGAAGASSSSSNCSGCEGGVQGAPLALLHIKCYNRWTKALGRVVQQVEAAQQDKGRGSGLSAAQLRQLRVRVEGPFGEVAFPHVPTGPQQGLVFVAGGWRAACYLFLWWCCSCVVQDCVCGAGRNGSSNGG